MFTLKDTSKKQKRPETENQLSLPDVNTSQAHNKGKEISSQRFIINVLANIFLLGIKTLMGLWFTPYLINIFGMAVYGIISLTNTTASYMNILGAALNSAIGRFLTIDLRKNQPISANKTFNTALWGNIGISIFLLPIILLFSWSVPHIFAIPQGYETGAQCLFATVLIAYLASILSSNFGISAFASNRLDLQNTIFASNLIVRVGVIVIIFSLTTPLLWHVGVGFLAGIIVSLVIAISIWRLLTPELSISIRFFDRLRLTKILGTSSWIVINQVGSLFFHSIDLIVINLFLGAEANGKYGSLLQWSILLRELARAASTALTPIILAQYAKHDHQGMLKTTRQAVKLLGVAMALPIGLIAGFSSPLLSVWLGPEFKNLNFLLVVLVSHLCINLSVLPLFSVQVALNRVRWPGIVTLITGIFNVGLAFAWVKWGNNGIGVAFAGALILTFKNAFFTPIYGAYIQKQRWYAFFSSMLPGILSTTLIGLFSYGLAIMVDVNSWIMLGSMFGLVSIVYLLVAYQTLDGDTKTLIWNTIQANR